MGQWNTSRHQSKVYDAIHSKKIINISGFGRRGTHSLKLNQYDFDNTLIKNNHYEVEKLLLKASRARLHGDAYKAQAYNIIQSLVEYATFLNLEYKNVDLDQFAQLAIENAKKEAAIEKARKAAAIEKQAENLQKWRNGENVRTSFETTALRINGDIVETSHGANIPLDQAVKLWPLVSSLHANGKEYTRSNNTIHLGGYKLLSFKNDVLTVGCHEIPFSELQILADQLQLN